MSDLIIKELVTKVQEGDGTKVVNYDIGADAENIFYKQQSGGQIDLQSQLDLYEKSLGIFDNTIIESNNLGHHVEGSHHIVKGMANHIEGTRHNINKGTLLHIEGVGHITGKIGFEDLEQTVIISLINEGNNVMVENLNESYFFDGDEYGIKITFSSNSIIAENIASIGNITKGILQGVQFVTAKSLCIRTGFDKLTFYIKGGYTDAASFYQLTSFEIQSIYQDIGSPVEGGHIQGVFSDIHSDNYLHIVGNGTANKRSNAHTLDWHGNAEFAGDVIAGGCGGSESVSLLQIANANKKPLVIYEKDIDNYSTSVIMGDKVLEAILAGRQIFIQLIDTKNSGTRALYSPVITYHLPINGNSRLELYYLKNNSDGITNLVEAIGYIPMILSKAYMDSPLV